MSDLSWWRNKHPDAQKKQSQPMGQKSSSATAGKQKQQTFRSFDNLEMLRDSIDEDKDKDKDKDKENTNRERQSRPQNKHSRFERKNNRYKKKKNHNSGSSTMAGEETFNISKYKDDKDFLASFVAENGNIDELAKTPEGQKRIKESWDKYQEKKNQSHSDDGQEKGDENNKETKGVLMVGELKSDDEPQQEENSDWIEKKRKSWKAWCENKDTHNGIAYTYDEDPEATGLKFDVFKDAEKTEKLATIEYTAPNSVFVTNDEGKVPDYEFFDQLVKDAQKDHDGIVFNGEMTDEFKTKLALACIVNDMPMNGFEERINIENLPDKGASLSDDIKKKIEYHNKYVDAKDKVEQHKNNPEKKDTPYKLPAEMKPEDAAITYAAYASAGIKVEGLKDIFKNPEGLIYTSDFEYMPKDAKETISKHNKNIHNKMIERTKNRQQVAGPVVAEDSHSKISPIQRNQEFFKQEPLVKKREEFSKKQQRFERFILSGLKQNH